MSNSDSAISHDVNKNTLIVAMCVGIVFVSCRTGFRWYTAHRFSWGEDGFCWMALVCQIVVTAIYLSILENIYFITRESSRRAAAAAIGDYANTKAHPDMKYHAEKMLRGLWPVQYFFWGCLWCVKFSLLLMFKRLTERVPFHLKMWRGVVVFTSLAFIGCVVSQLCSCTSISKFTQFGGCSSERDLELQSISLYYSLAVDVLSDLLIMAIPISLIWNLQINLMEKIGVGLAFSAGLATVIIAFLRAFLLQKSGKDLKNSKQLVDITWLCFWACIECCIAVVVNCLPSFAILVRTKVNQHRSGGASNGYGQMGSVTGKTLKSRGVKSNIQMDDMERYSEENVEGRPGYKMRPDAGKYITSVSISAGNVGRPQNSGGNHMSNSSQESIMGPEHKTKEVYVTRTVEIS